MKRKCHDYLTLLTSTENLFTRAIFQLAPLEHWSAVMIPSHEQILVNKSLKQILQGNTHVLKNQ